MIRARRRERGAALLLCAVVLIAHLAAFAQDLPTANLRPTYRIVSWRAVVPDGPVGFPGATAAR